MVTQQLEIPRDRWGRPLITPLDGGDPVAYTRVSVLAKALDDQSNLTAWKQRKTAEGLVKRPALITRLAGALANGNPDVDAVTKREFNSVCKEAVEAAGASSGASAGTGLHALTEAIDRGVWPEFVPAADEPRLRAYKAATSAYQPVDAETFIVNDAIAAAGSLDRLWRCPDGRVRVGDLKSGKWDNQYPLGVTTQVAIYAHGLRYDLETGQRSPLHPDLDLTAGLLIHMPPDGGCTIYPLDLVKGWRAAQAAYFVHHDVRRWKAADLMLDAAW